MYCNFFIILLMLGFSACAPRAVVFFNKNYYTHPINRIALLEFTDYPSYPGSGEIIASTFESYLLGAGYNLIERRQINKILKEQDLDLSRFDQATISKIGKLLGVDALAFGSLTNFSNIREQTVMVNMPQQQSEPMFGQTTTVAHNGNTTIANTQNYISGYSYSYIDYLVPKIETLPASIGMSVRLVSVETGELLWSASASGSGDNLTLAAQEASSKLMQEIIKQMKQNSKM